LRLVGKRPTWESQILPLGNCNIDSKENAHASLRGFVYKRDTKEPSGPSGPDYEEYSPGSAAR